MPMVCFELNLRKSKSLGVLNYQQVTCWCYWQCKNDPDPRQGVPENKGDQQLSTVITIYTIIGLINNQGFWIWILSRAKILTVQESRITGHFSSLVNGHLVLDPYK